MTSRSGSSRSCSSPPRWAWGTCPLLLIWTSRGVGGECFNPPHFDRAGAGAEIWEIAGNTHIDGLRTRPEEYERRVVGFFDRALGVG